MDSTTRMRSWSKEKRVSRWMLLHARRIYRSRAAERFSSANDNSLHSQLALTQVVLNPSSHPRCPAAVSEGAVSAPQQQIRSIRLNVTDGFYQSHFQVSSPISKFFQQFLQWTDKLDESNRSQKWSVLPAWTLLEEKLLWFRCDMQPSSNCC